MPTLSQSTFSVSLALVLMNHQKWAAVADTSNGTNPTERQWWETDKQLLTEAVFICIKCKGCLFFFEIHIIWTHVNCKSPSNSLWKYVDQKFYSQYNAQIFLSQIGRKTVLNSISRMLYIQSNVLHIRIHLWVHACRYTDINIYESNFIGTTGMQFTYLL